MGLPVKLIHILAGQTSAESLECNGCKGAGETVIFDAETGGNTVVCEDCLGTGYNQLGLILQGILQPPEEGYGSVELREAIDAWLEKAAEVSGEEEESAADEKRGLPVSLRGFLQELKRRRKIS